MLTSFFNFQSCTYELNPRSYKLAQIHFSEVASVFHLLLTHW